MQDGEIDVYTVRDEDGTLTGVRVADQEEYDARTEAAEAGMTSADGTATGVTIVEMAEDGAAAEDADGEGNADGTGDGMHTYTITMEDGSVIVYEIPEDGSVVTENVISSLEEEAQ